MAESPEVSPGPDQRDYFLRILLRRHRELYASGHERIQDIALDRRARTASCYAGGPLACAFREPREGFLVECGEHR
jgi:hypothetical protein